MTSSRDMTEAVCATLVIDTTLAELSRRVATAEEPLIELDYLINKAFGLPQTCSPMTSLDDTLRVLRERFPAPEWRYGFQDAGFKGYTGPTCWLNNGRCQKVGFDNHTDLEYRYFERTARRIEWAFAALVLHAMSYRTVDSDAILG